MIMKPSVKKGIIISIICVVQVCMILNGVSAEKEKPESLWNRFLPLIPAAYGPQRIYQKDILNLITPIGPPPASETKITWKGYTKGPVNVLFIVPFKETRYPFEFAARFDIKYQVLPAEIFNGRRWKPKKRERWAKRHGPELIDAIENGKFDVVVSRNVNGGLIDKKSRQRLLKMVENGMGWVELDSGDGELPIYKNLPVFGQKGSLKNIPDIRVDHFITDGFPRNYSVRSYVPRKLNGTALIKVKQGVAVAIGSCGKGRCISCPAGWLAEEAGYSLIMKSILWATGKESEYGIRTMKHAGFRQDDFREMIQKNDFVHSKRSQAGIPVRLFAATPVSATLDWEIRDVNKTMVVSGRIDDVKLTEKEKTMFVLPKKMLPTGTYNVYYKLLDIKTGKLLNWAEDSIEIKGLISLAKVNLPEFYPRNAEKLTGTLVFENLDSKQVDLDVTINVLDSCRRRLPFSIRKKCILVAGNRTESPFEIPCDFSYIFANVGILDIKVAKAGKQIIHQHNQFCSPQSPKKCAEDWQQIAWGSGPISLFPTFVKMFREWGYNALGFGIWRYPGNIPILAKSGLTLHLEYIATNFGHWGRTGKNHQWMARLCTKKYHDALVAKVKKRATILRKYGVQGYACSEEIGLGPVEVCFSESSIAAFQKWCLKKYGDIKAVNTSWGTEYKSPDEIKGILLADEIKESPDNPAQWIDFRLFMEDVYCGLMEAYCRAGLGIDPAAGFGYNAGPYGEIYTQGHNRARLGKTINYCIEYHESWLGIRPEVCLYDIFRSRHLPMLYSVIGYPTVYMKTRNRYNYRTWYTALHEGRGCGYYATISAPIWSKFDGTFAPNGASKIVKECNDDLRAGLGKLIIRSKRDNCGIGVYYSRTSLYQLAFLHAKLDRNIAEREAEAEKEADILRADPGAVVKKKNKTEKNQDEVSKKKKEYAKRFRRLGVNSRTTMRELAISSGFNYDFVFKDQLLSGEIKKKFKILILPMIISLSKEEINALYGFVENGGLLVADMMTGFYDERGRVNPLKGRIDTLFGIDREIILPELNRTSFELQGYSTPVTAYGFGKLKTAGGTALVDTNNRQAVVINKHGKGMTLYFSCLPAANEIFERHWMPQMIDSPFRTQFIKMASETGVKQPLIASSGDQKLPGIQGMEIVPYSQGNNHFLFFLRRFTELPENIRIKLPDAGHVYEIRNRKYVGETRDFLLNIPEEGDVAGYALLSYQVKSLELKSQKDKIYPGEKLNLFVKLITEPVAKDNHVVNVTVTDPDGKIDYRFSKNIYLNGADGNMTMALTLDEKPGTWNVTAYDVISGIKSKLAFNVKKRQK